MSRIVIIFIILLSFISCGRDSKEGIVTGKSDENKRVEMPEMNSSFRLQHIRTIGNDDDRNYIFVKVRDVKFDANKNFYVADFKGYCIAKYSFDGKHIVRTGKHGQGPKEFISLQSILVEDNKLYAHDVSNDRLSIYDSDLKFLSSRKIEPSVARIKGIADNDSLITINFYNNYGQDHGRIALINRRGEEYRSYFNRHWFGEYKSGNKRDEGIKKFGTVVQACYSVESGDILIGFRTSRAPVDIFLLNKTGSIKQILKYEADPEYQLPEWYYNQELAHQIFRPGSKMKSDSNRIRLDSLFIYKNRYFVFLKYQNSGIYHADTHKHLFLVFDESGKLISETELKNDLTFFDISEDGYLIGADVEAEVPTVQIHKLVINQ